MSQMNQQQIGMFIELYGYKLEIVEDWEFDANFQTSSSAPECLFEILQNRVVLPKDAERWLCFLTQIYPKLKVGGVVHPLEGLWIFFKNAFGHGPNSSTPPLPLGSDKTFEEVHLNVGYQSTLWSQTYAADDERVKDRIKDFSQTPRIWSKNLSLCVLPKTNADGEFNITFTGFWAKFITEA